jgi:hypothetical protein
MCVVLDFFRTQLNCRVSREMTAHRCSRELAFLFSALKTGHSFNRHLAGVDNRQANAVKEPGVVPDLFQQVWLLFSPIGTMAMDILLLFLSCSLRCH